MPRPELPNQPITDRLLDALIALFKLEPDEPMSEPEARLMFQAIPLALEELRTYRQLLGRTFAADGATSPVEPDELMSEAEARLALEELRTYRQQLCQQTFSADPATSPNVVHLKARPRLVEAQDFDGGSVA